MDISFTVFMCFRLFVRLRISPPRIKLAASSFARRFIGTQGRESHLLGKFAPQKSKIGRIGVARALADLADREATFVAYRVAHELRSACVDICQSH